MVMDLQILRFSLLSRLNAGGGPRAPFWRAGIFKILYIRIRKKHTEFITNGKFFQKRFHFQFSTISDGLQTKPSC